MSKGYASLAIGESWQNYRTLFINNKETTMKQDLFEKILIISIMAVTTTALVMGCAIIIIILTF